MTSTAVAGARARRNGWELRIAIALDRFIGVTPGLHSDGSNRGLGRVLNRYARFGGENAHGPLAPRIDGQPPALAQGLPTPAPRHNSQSKSHAGPSPIPPEANTLHRDRFPPQKSTMKLHILGICGTFMGGLAALA